MPWFWQRPSSDSSQDSRNHASSAPDHVRPAQHAPPSSQPARFLHSLRDPTTLASTAVLTSLILGVSYVYRTRLRRITNIDHLPSATLHTAIATHPRTLFGRVLTVGDGDGLRFYHTPGGRLAFWGLLRKVPEAPFPRNDKRNPHVSFLSAQTLSVRLSGIDAPEGAHFGKQAQPFAAEALDYLRQALLGRNVRLYPHSKDQYGRVVGTVLVRPLGGLGIAWPRAWQRDVGLEMIQRGLATVYEAKFGSEFGGAPREQALKDAQRKAQAGRQGMWALRGSSSGAAERSSNRAAAGRLSLLESITSLFRKKPADHGTLETPREYKQRLKTQGEHRDSRKR